MPFVPGELCCVTRACVLIDTTPNGSSATWDRIPHVTNISVQQTANTQKLVTSSTGGKETSACGTVTQTGTLAVACHSGTEPGYLCVNQSYRIRWSLDCDNIWDVTSCSAVADNDMGVHLEAYIRITSLPINYNIQGNAPVIQEYNFDVIGWAAGGAPEDYCQAAGPAIGDVFIHCDAE